MKFVAAISSKIISLSYDLESDTIVLAKTTVEMGSERGEMV